MGRRKIRRRQHGSAWHRKQTDCSYYTMLGTKTGVPLFDDAGERVRGCNNQEAAEAALTRVRLANLAEASPSDR